MTTGANRLPCGRGALGTGVQDADGRTSKGEPVVVGEIVLGRFRLLARIGAGGFGTVYRGRDERLERPVAVKVIDAHGSGITRRVLREAHAAARLSHPGIVTLYELGESAGRAYLVSELVEGATLDRLAAQRGLSDRDVAELGVDLCDALAHAHERGVVHRDVKPQNVIVCDDGAGAPRAMLMDFGTAFLADAPVLTATGEVIGTIAYMAPEQAEGLEVGAPADVYALALTLYECWSGENPLARATPAATARAIGEPIPSLGSARPDLPPEMCEALDACLAVRPELRPRVEELEGELERAGRRLSDARPVPSRAARRDAAAMPSARAEAVARVALLSMIAVAVAWLGLVGGLPGAALIVGILLLPAPLLLRAPWQWALPAAAPLLGGIGLAPAYPALAALAGSSRERAILALLGWAWLVVSEAILGSRLLFGTESAPGGWSGSLLEAGSEVVLGPLTPDSALLALAWVAASVLLGAVMRGRTVALELLAVLVWAAGVVAMHGVLAGGGSEPHAGPLTVALVAVAATAMWVRFSRASRASRRGRTALLP